MSERILVPALGESVTEATVAKWLKNEGDKVNIDEAIVELETDKVNVEVPATSNGTIEKISVKEGQTVNVGALLGTIAQLKSSEANISSEEKKYSPPSKKPQAIKEEEKIEVIKKEERDESEEAPLVLTKVHSEKKISRNLNVVSPSARKLATESNIDLS
jgi:2-oxoglutarate dehydrogenase E2 component (dihydrolipoamide succinyltransferase)